MISAERRSPRAIRLREALGAGRPVSAVTLALTAIVVVAAVIRLLVLDNQSLWADEALTTYESTLSLGRLWHIVTSVEVTPPLYFGLVWAWAHVLGHGPATLRLLSALCGIALVPVAYGAAATLVSRRAGLLAAALVALNPMMVWYSQEARAYMLLTLECGAALWAFALVWRARGPAPRALAAWAVLAALAVMTHFFAGFAIAPQGLALLWRRRSRATWLACAAVALVQVAMLPFAIADTSAAHGTGWIAKVPLTHRVSTAVVEWGASLLYRRSTVLTGAAAAAVALAVLGLLLWRARPGAERRGALLAAALAAPVLIVPALLRLAGLDFWLSRNELPAFVAVIVVFAATATLPGVRRSGAVLAGVLLVLFAVATAEVQTHPYLQRADWRRVAAALGPAVRSRVVLAAGGTTAQPLKIYLPGVPWSEPPSAQVMISELDVVGATKRLALDARANGGGAGGGVAGSTALVHGRHHHARRPAPLPRRTAPRGTRLLGYEKVANWVIARFAFRRPHRVTLAGLRHAAGRWFVHPPKALLILVQAR